MDQPQNIYTVIFQNRKLTCDCPDNAVGCRYFNIICKHSCFVLCKVLKCNESIFEPLKKRDNMILTDNYMIEILKEFSKLKDKIQIQNSSIVKKELIDKYNKFKKKN